MPLTKSQAGKTRKFAYDYYKTLDATHGIEHLERTLKLAAYLAEKEEADKLIVKYGAMLHQFHDADTVEKFLNRIKVDKGLAGKVAHCVRCSDMRNARKAKTIEAKVVYDADKLQVVGPFGIMREISCDMAPQRGMGFREALEHTRAIERKCFETLQTRTAKRMAEQPHNYVVRFWEILDMWDKAKF